ncbi:MAG: ATP-binding cassette domain-containing protein [Saprospiraceae bacterium]|nr:ATP-binding cassette domain-containing protein [Saprospiraceae bacterium]MCB9327422.1 ATP-binding cassette domain-containing protein [Lewinellaceae bacterium]HPK09416.1 ATP-binding cassette domain-containing protein [Saprospiraceae bacterium]
MIESRTNIRNPNSIELVNVKGLYKKFCSNTKYNMIYGMHEIAADTLSLNKPSKTLRKHEFWALNDLNFSLYSNEITALLGVNGCGKTTLIRMLAGIYDTKIGQITYNKDVKKVCSVFAIKSGLNQYLTGVQNIFLKGAYFGMTKEEIEEKLEFISQLSGLGKHLNAPLGKYSSGMQTRLAMSVAMSVDCDVLFIDEGFSFSDPGFKERCFDHLRVTYRNNHKALVFASHHVHKIEELASRVILLDKGKFIDSTYDVSSGVEQYVDLCR